MNVALWIVAGLLSVLFLLSGISKLALSRQKLTAMLPWVEDFGQGSVRAIGGLEVLGAVGLILPPALGILPVLVPVAALGFVVLMAGAFVTHLRRSEPQGYAITIILICLSAFVAWGRFGTYPFAS